MALLLLSFQHELVVADDLTDCLFDLASSLFSKLRHDDLRLASGFRQVPGSNPSNSEKTNMPSGWKFLPLSEPWGRCSVDTYSGKSPVCLPGMPMAVVTVRPTSADIAIANAIAAHTDPPAEQTAEALTWGADEHVLMALAVGWWVYSRGRRGRQRIAADHVLITTLVATALPHVLKAIFDQRRPDRLTVRGHWRGIPLSGNSMDAFPSGHALHIGALASAASELPRKQRNLVWLIGAGLVATRVLLLAHWTSDVLAGLAIGSLTERLLRRLTGYGRVRPPTAGPRR